MLEYTYRFSMVKGKHQEFINWVNDNDQVLKDHAADGWTYLGTWFVVRGFGDFDAEMRFVLDGYGALGAGFGDDENQRLIREFFADFVDFGRPANAYLLKSSTDVETVEGT